MRHSRDGDVEANEAFLSPKRKTKGTHHVAGSSPTTNHRLTLTRILKGIGSFALVAALLAFYGVLFFGSPVDVVATHTSQADTKNGDGGIVKVPGEAGTIALAYNLPGVKGRLNLPQDVYADIFLGKIRMWNDPRIRAANKNLNLPAIMIAVICRPIPVKPPLPSRTILQPSARHGRRGLAQGRLSNGRIS